MVQNLTTEPIESYDINSIEIGLKKQFNVTITESMLDNFAQLSGVRSFGSGETSIVTMWSVRVRPRS